MNTFFRYSLLNSNVRDTLIDDKGYFHYSIDLLTGTTTFKGKIYNGNSLYLVLCPNGELKYGITFDNFELRYILEGNYIVLQALSDTSLNGINFLNGDRAIIKLDNCGRITNIKRITGTLSRGIYYYYKCKVYFVIKFTDIIVVDGVEYKKNGNNALIGTVDNSIHNIVTPPTNMLPPQRSTPWLLVLNNKIYAGFDKAVNGQALLDIYVYYGNRLIKNKEIYAFARSFTTDECSIYLVSGYITTRIGNKVLPSNPDGVGGFKIVLDEDLNIDNMISFPYFIYSFFVIGYNTILIINSNKYDREPSNSQVMVRDKCGCIVERLYKFNGLITPDTHQNIYVNNEKILLYVDNGDNTTLVGFC